MRELKLSTAKGKRVYDMGMTCYNNYLWQLYDNWSPKKQKAFDWCWEQYIADENSESFGIGNANTYGFTASWICTYKGEDALRVETKDNSYIVYLNK